MANPRRKPETETETESVTESAEVATAMQNIYRLPHGVTIYAHFLPPPPSSRRFPSSSPTTPTHPLPFSISYFAQPSPAHSAGTRTRSAAPRVQKVLPTVLISHNYTITKRKVFSTRHASRSVPSCRPSTAPIDHAPTQCQLRVMEMSSQKNNEKKRRRKSRKLKNSMKRVADGGDLFRC